MNKQIIGSCSICGGAVTLPAYCHSVIPPRPTCEQCGAVAKPAGPVIPMERPTRKNSCECCQHSWLAGDTRTTCPIHG